jgi:hypothetical protein
MVVADCERLLSPDASFSDDNLGTLATARYSQYAVFDPFVGIVSIADIEVVACPEAPL